jgi:hypothetical protein
MLPRNQEPASPDVDKVQEKDAKYKDYVTKHYNVHHNVQPLPVLKPGDEVRLKTDEQSSWSDPATVVAQTTERSYVVETPQGRQYKRNRHHMLSVPEQSDAPPEQPQQEQSDIINKDTATPAPRRSGRTVKPVQRLDL